MVAVVTRRTVAVAGDRVTELIDRRTLARLIAVEAIGTRQAGFREEEMAIGERQTGSFNRYPTHHREGRGQPHGPGGLTHAAHSRYPSAPEGSRTPQSRGDRLYRWGSGRALCSSARTSQVNRLDTEEEGRDQQGA